MDAASTRPAVKARARACPVRGRGIIPDQARSVALGRARISLANAGGPGQAGTASKGIGRLAERPVSDADRDREGEPT